VEILTLSDILMFSAKVSYEIVQPLVVAEQWLSQLEAV
jgi:hypothetical protein